MLPGLMANVGPVIGPNSTMREVIRALNLEPGLKLLLDAGDHDSYAGTGQVWSDLSGGGYDFNRGATSSAQSDDPTYNGTAGGQSSSEYWSFDGGDFFTYDTTNETWMQNIHKNSALFSICAWIRPASAADQGVSGTFTTPSSAPSWNFALNADRTIGFASYNGSVNSTITSTALYSTGAWTFFGLGVDEAAGTAFLQIDGTQEDKSLVYNAPSSSNAPTTMQIGAVGAAFGPLSNTSRMGSIIVHEAAALTKAQAMQVFNATRAKYGI